MVESSELFILDFLEKDIRIKIENLEKEIFKRKRDLSKIEMARLKIRSKRNDSDKRKSKGGS